MDICFCFQPQISQMTQMAIGRRPSSAFRRPSSAFCRRLSASVGGFDSPNLRNLRHLRLRGKLGLR
jgi:hypothetical protein